MAQLALYLGPLVAPRYRVVVERRTYLALSQPDDVVGMPDLGVVESRSEEPVSQGAPLPGSQMTPLIAELPQPEERRERYLEIREVGTGDLVTVVELLSPDNKRPGEGRKQYEQKRLHVLSTLTHLVEIDLLRAGQPMPMRILGNGRAASYRIVISRSHRRPQAEVYLFGIRDPLPGFRLPLQPGDEEPMVDLGKLLHEIYDRARFDLAVDYTQPPPPPSLSEEDAAWLDERLWAAGLREQSVD
jgi:hypothetical protein